MESILAAMAMSAFGAGAPSTPAAAAIPPQDPSLDAVKTYAIPAGPMSGALTTFAEKNGLHLLYDARATHRLRSPGLVGSHSLRGGLDRLLMGTGYAYRFADVDGNVSIVLAQATETRNDATPISSATPLPAIDIGAEARAPESRNAGAGQGPGDRHTGYRADTASSALKMDAPIMQTPVSVQVVTRQTLDDRQAISMTDALVTNVSGVQPSQGFFDVLKIRGFGTFGNTFKNGLQENRYRYLDTTNLQSIEVLKGPAAMLFGRLEPGGVINMVVKRPLETPYYSLEQQVGSYGLTRTTLDATGPVLEDKSVLYRFNGEFYRTDSYRDFVSDQNVFLAPTVTLHPIEQFRMNIDFEYHNRNWVENYPIYPAIGGSPANIPSSRYFHPAYLTTGMNNHFEKKRIAYDFTYDFAPGWSLTNRLSYANLGTRILNAFPGTFNQATGDLTRTGTYNPGFTDKTFTTNLDVKGKFVTGPFEHSLLVGFDYFNWYGPMLTAFNPPLSSINIYAPTYWQFENIYRNPQFLQNGAKWTGVYVQDMISFFDDSVHVLLGGRYDWAETYLSRFRTSPYLAAATYWASYDQGFNPRVGVVYQPQPWITLYGNFTRGMSANNVTTLGETLPPQQGEQFEGGVKIELFDKRLLATMAYFDITKTNIPVTNPSNASQTSTIGRARSQGFEFDLTGRIDDNWSVIANYTHDDVRTIDGTATDPLTAYTRQIAVSGSKLPASPRNYGNIWIKYDAAGELKGLSLGGGLTVVESSLGDTANSFVLPDYTLLDGMIAYTTKIEGYNVTAQLNVKNITDTVYYPTAGSRTTIVTGTPRTFLGSLRMEF
ncbi:TonB-dependent siderophore receptor [Methylosinus sporium]|uniref:TonB-dependent siderophore receptor n=1 Tax=Methylosinus sporium TaxID=428 RepID=UPI000D59ED6E|nr:TonB-dependent receptor [Methylosinus sporium]PWB88420.1 TonB-dependent siderophore receptor [Methylocystis sp. MitZ-2018]